MSAAPTSTPWPHGCGAGTTSTPSQMSVSPRQIAPHLHPRYSPEAGRGRTNNGHLHDAGDVSQSKRDERTEYPSAHLSTFPRISACGSGCGSKLTRPLTHESNPPKSKEKVLFSLENRTFWSCWADSNRRPHPYQPVFDDFYNNFSLFLVVFVPNNIVSRTFEKCSLRCFHTCLW